MPDAIRFGGAFASGRLAGLGLRAGGSLLLSLSTAYVGSPTQLSNYLTLKGSFSGVSKPKFASKYALESSRRDLQNTLLRTVSFFLPRDGLKMNSEKTKHQPVMLSREKDVVYFYLEAQLHY